MQLPSFGELYDENRPGFTNDPDRSRRLLTEAAPVALFLDSADKTAPTSASINPAPREALLRLIAAAPVRLVVSGHLHTHRDVTVGGVRTIWAPALSFVHAADCGATPMIAALSLDFTDASPILEIVTYPGLVAHDLDAIKRPGGYAFLHDMPQCPPTCISPIPIPVT